MEFVQLLTASLYLFERCFDFLSESVEEANVTYEGDDKEVVIAELRAFQQVYKQVLRQFNDLHLGMSAAASLERIQKLTEKYGLIDEAEAESRLLISDGLIKSLGLDRATVTKYINEST